MKLTKQDEKAMQKAVDESIKAEANISTEHQLTTQQPEGTIALNKPFKGVDIEGLEDVPMSMIALPFMRLVQPTSKKTTLSNGSDAPVGSFLLDDTQEAFPEVEFVLLRSKVEPVSFPQEDGTVQNTMRLSILGIKTDDDRLFILGLSPTSFSNFGRLIAKFKALHVDKTWRFTVKMTSEKQENKKGKYFVVNLQIGSEVTGEAFDLVEQKAKEYGVALDRQNYQEEES